MARPKAKVPARRYHLSGQSFVTIAGRDYYLGPHDSPLALALALALYAVLIGVYQSNGLSLPDGLEVTDLDAQAAAMLGISSPAAAPAQQANEPTSRCSSATSQLRIGSTREATIPAAALGCRKPVSSLHQSLDPPGGKNLEACCQSGIDHRISLVPPEIGGVATGRPDHGTGNQRRGTGMNRDPKAFCFSPRESIAWFRAQRTCAQRTGPSNHPHPSGAYGRNSRSMGASWSTSRSRRIQHPDQHRCTAVPIDRLSTSARRDSPREATAMNAHELPADPKAAIEESHRKGGPYRDVLPGNCG